MTMRKRTKKIREEEAELVAKESDRLHAIFWDLPDNKREVAKELIERVAFMTVQLKSLEKTIEDFGPTYKFKNGAQEMIIENPAQKSYNTMINRYTAAYDKLINLTNSLEKNDEDEEDNHPDI